MLRDLEVTLKNNLQSSNLHKEKSKHTDKRNFSETSQHSNDNIRPHNSYMINDISTYLVFSVQITKLFVFLF